MRKNIRTALFTGGAIAIVVLNAVPAANAGTGWWSTVAPGLPVANDSMAVASGAADGNIYLFGGMDTGSGGALAFDPSSGAVSTLPAMPAAPMYAGASISKGFAYVVGGTDPTGPSSNPPPVSAVEVFDLATKTWQQGPALPSAVEGPQVAADAVGRVYSFGGWDGNAQSSQAVVDAGGGDSTAAWTPVGPGFAPRAFGAAITSQDGKIYVFGGYDPATGTPSTTAQVYDPTADSWSTMAAMPDPRSHLGATLGADGKIYAVGGYDATGPSREVDQFDPTTGTWTVLTDAALPQGTYALGVGHSLGATGSIYTFGGIDIAGYDVTDVYSYTPATSITTPPPAANGQSQSTSVRVTTPTSPPGVLTLQVQNPAVSFGTVPAGGSATNIAAGDLIYNDSLANSNAWSVTAVASDLTTGSNTIGYSNLTFTPGAFTSGPDAMGPPPTAGPAGTAFSGTGSSSLPITIATGTTTTRGTYSQTGSTMSLTVPAGAPAGSYTGQIQYTITG